MVSYFLFRSLSLYNYVFLSAIYEDFTVLNEEERKIYIEKSIEDIKIKEEKRAQRRKKQEENKRK